MELNEALKVIKSIAERHERDMRACEMARRIERERRDALHAAPPESSGSSGDEAV